MIDGFVRYNGTISGFRLFSQENTLTGYMRVANFANLGGCCARVTSSSKKERIM